MALADTITNLGSAIINLVNSKITNAISANNTEIEKSLSDLQAQIDDISGSSGWGSITNEIGLNNPFTLFDSRYAEAQLYNASWLKSSEEYYSKSIYVTAYEALVVENNAGITAGESVSLPSGTTYVKRGLSVKLSTDEDITDYDFVINTTDETFRLPLKNGMEGMFGGSAVVGNGIALGLTTGSAELGLMATAEYCRAATNASGISLNTNVGTSGSRPSAGQTLGVTTDPSLSGLVVSGSGEVPEGWSLYYYVGQTT